MDRAEFEALRDLAGKKITQDVRWTATKALSPWLEWDGIPIENSAGLDLRIVLKYNPETGSKTVNVYVPGTGPICRLDVDGTNHGDAGRSHKHALQKPRCPDKNLPHATARADLAGKSMRVVFNDFCALAKITHEGTYEHPGDE